MLEWLQRLFWGEHAAPKPPPQATPEELKSYRLPELPAALNGNDPVKRREAIDELLRKADPRAPAFEDDKLAKQVLRLRLESDWKQRSSAAQELGNSGDARVLPWLVDAMTDPNECANTRSHAGGALRELVQRGLVEEVVTLLSHPDETVCGAAALAFEDSGKVSVVPALLQLLPRESWQAARSLGSLNAPGVFEALVAALDSSDPTFAGNAAMSLAKLGDPRAFEPLEKARQTWRDKVAPTNALIELRRKCPKPD